MMMMMMTGSAPEPTGSVDAFGTGGNDHGGDQAVGPEIDDHFDRGAPVADRLEEPGAAQSFDPLGIVTAVRQALGFETETDPVGPGAGLIDTLVEREPHIVRLDDDVIDDDAPDDCVDLDLDVD